MRDPAGTALEPRQCPRCKNRNAHDALYCVTCSTALVEEAARKVDESTEEAKRSEDYLQLVRQLKKDLGLPQ